MSVTDIADEACQLYCSSRCHGGLRSLWELEKRRSTSPESALGGELIWEGYFGKALHYCRIEDEKHDPNLGRQKAVAIFAAILPALEAAAAAEEDEGESCSPHVLYLLGWYFHGALGVAKDYDRSIRLFRLAADQGLAIAESNLGYCYALGTGVPEDKTEAIRWYRLAASKGHAPAQYNLGVNCIHGISPNYGKAVSHFRLAAEQGFSSAEYLLGVMYCGGNGVERDTEVGVAWFQKAVSKGCAHAQHALSRYCLRGIGTPQDEKAAVRLVRLAANQGLARSQLALGVHYASGVGVDRDPKEAVKWYRLAAAQGLPHSLFVLGDCYEHGIGVDLDIIEAVKWYTKAANNDVPGASEALESTKDAYVEAIWNNRKAFLLFLARYQFIYRPPTPPASPAAITCEKTPLSARTETLRLLTPLVTADPDVVHTVFHTDDMRREIMSFL